MSFVAVSPPAVTAEAPIDCGPFLPAIHPQHARERMRLDGTITPQRLRAALIDAAAHVAQDLSTWISQQIAAGHPSLAEVPGPHIDQASVRIAHWHRAVECHAAANLIERHRGYDSTANGHDRADAATLSIDELRRDARWATSDLVGRPRSTVDLI